MNITLKETIIEQWNNTPTEKGPKGVLVLATPFSAVLAELFGVAYLLDEDGACRTNIDGISIDAQIQDMMLHLPNAAGGVDTFYPQLVHKIKLRKDGEVDMEMLLRVHFAKKDEILSITEFYLARNKDPFEVTLASRQGELFEAGTRVDMAAGPEDDHEGDAEEPTSDEPECSMCAEGLPLETNNTHTVSKRGKKQKVKCLMFRKQKAEPALSSAREMRERGEQVQ